MFKSSSLSMEGLELVVPAGAARLGTRVLAGLVALAERSVERFDQLRRQYRGACPTAVVSRVRGTGRGVSFTSLVAELERAHPVSLEYPFEDSERVGGAVWIARELLGGASTTSVAKLRWDSRALDLPMHVHDFSDRFIIVLKGRGFFHVSDESPERFSGERVRSIPARERDVFLFKRGTMHTFSTDEEPMTLLSCQLPFLAFNDPKQYRLPKVRWVAKDRTDGYAPTVACDPGWSVIAQGSAMGAVSAADVISMGP